MSKIFCYSYSICVVEAVQTNPQLFTEHNHARRTSEASILSTVSGIADTLPIQAINKCKLLLNYCHYTI